MNNDRIENFNQIISINVIVIIFLKYIPDFCLFANETFE